MADLATNRSVAGTAKIFLIWAWIALFGVGFLRASSQEPASPVPYRAVLNRYCVACHNEKLKTAGLMLDKADVENAGAIPAIWEKVIRKLRAGAMPPAGLPRPDAATYDSFASYLETAIDQAAAARPNPGRPASVHRLNRAEYSNAIRDLLATDVDAGSLLPADDAGYGFDNIGDALSVSPMLLERYMSAARKISRLALGDASQRPAAVSYDLPRLLLQDDRMSEDLPFGSRGGIAIRHRFPMDGEYTVKIVLARTSREYVRGIAERHEIEVRLDGAVVRQFTFGGEHKAKSGPLYTSANIIGDPAQEEYEHTADAGLEFRIPVHAGTRLLGVVFPKETVEPEGLVLPPESGFDIARNKGGDPAVGSVIINGPYEIKGPGDTASRRKIFVCYPRGVKDEDICAKKILSTLSARAYRRPVTEADVRMLLRYYQAGRKDAGFEDGIAAALQMILVSPDFLIRVERDPTNVPPDIAYRLSDLELASRLSFFLWSSLPDEELLGLAEHGRLKDPLILEQQVRRMLADSRSKSLVSNFAGQWLYLRNLRMASPDRQSFPDFDENLRAAFQQETELFFENMLREDRSVLDLLRADYTFVNERLARHYGIPNVYGSHFRRVAVADENRKGLLGQGSVLVVTSYASRTSPTLRGKWLLENILGAPPPPPPANVPSLKDRGENGQILSVRQQMERHRANPACAVCHLRMDPLGFALENFDAIGKWRTTSGAENTLVDSSGVLPDGTKFDGPAGLRKILLGHPQEFATTVIEKLLTYALGRGVEYYDEPAVRRILRESSPGDYRWSSLILGIVKSAPFQMRMSRGSETTASLRVSQKQ